MSRGARVVWHRGMLARVKKNPTGRGRRSGRSIELHPLPGCVTDRPNGTKTGSLQKARTLLVTPRLSRGYQIPDGPGVGEPSPAVEAADGSGEGDDVGSAFVDCCRDFGGVFALLMNRLICASVHPAFSAWRAACFSCFSASLTCACSVTLSATAAANSRTAAMRSSLTRSA